MAQATHHAAAVRLIEQHSREAVQVHCIRPPLPWTPEHSLFLSMRSRWDYKHTCTRSMAAVCMCTLPGKRDSQARVRARAARLGVPPLRPRDAGGEPVQEERRHLRPHPPACSPPALWLHRQCSRCCSIGAHAAAGQSMCTDDTQMRDSGVHSKQVQKLGVQDQDHAVRPVPIACMKAWQEPNQGGRGHAQHGEHLVQAVKDERVPASAITRMGTCRVAAACPVTAHGPDKPPERPCGSGGTA